MNGVDATYDDLARELERVAEAIVADGTAAERTALRAVADAARWAAPGAAAALLDQDATEVFRLRAFGTLHGVVLAVLDEDARAWLLGRLRGTGDAPADARAA